jgi:hypothetical protein
MTSEDPTIAINGRRNMYGYKVNVVYEPPEDGLI